jgi:hypothetical protein
MKKAIAIITLLISVYRQQMHGVVYAVNHKADFTGNYTVVVDDGTIVINEDPEDLETGDNVTITFDIFGNVESVRCGW